VSAEGARAVEAAGPAAAPPPAGRSARRVLGCRRGASALEFALVGGMFFIAMLAMIDLGRYYMNIQSLRNFAADAERFGIVNMFWEGTGERTATCADVLNAVNRGGPITGIATTSPGTCVTRRQTSAGGVYTVTVIVSINVNFRFVMNVFGVSPNYQESSTVTFLL
jgi:Flp pilus assembly protein TadG